jgi:hypothetical protein
MFFEGSVVLTDIITAIGLAFESALRGEFKGMFASIFFLLTFANLWSVIYQLRIRHWPATTGKLLMAATEEFGATEINPSDVNYTNVVSYEYTVDGETYIGRRLSPWIVVATHNLKAILENQLDGLTTGGHLPVFYNSAKPQLAFLKRPGGLGILITLGFAVFCLVTPMLVFG